MVILNYLSSIGLLRQERQVVKLKMPITAFIRHDVHMMKSANSLIYGWCDFSSWQYNPARTRHPWRIQARSYREYDGMKANRPSRVISKWTLNRDNGQSTSTELRSNRPPPRPSVTRFSFLISFFWASSASSASLAPVAAFLPQWTPIILFFSSFVSLL